jgi:K+-transporting ATPase c subunit
MEGYLDTGVANWASSSTNTPWLNLGGDFHPNPVFSQYFEKGTEDLNTEVTSLVEQWISGIKQNNGIVIKLIDAQETGSVSYYTKKFSARGSEFFFKRPWIEAQFDSSNLFKDDRGSFYNSSSLAPGPSNLNTLMLYNRHRGALVDIPAVGTGNIYVSLYSGSTGPVDNPIPLQGGTLAVTGSWISTGIYSAQVAINTSLPYLFDVWHNNFNGTQFFTGSAITVLDPTQDEISNEIPEYVLNIKNLKQSYSSNETARFSLFVREKNWSPTIYTIASQPAMGTIIEDAYFKLFRISDNLEVIPYGTGSVNHTRLSFDKTANYFDLDMKLLEPDYSYAIKFVFLNAGKYYEQRELFKFRVDD